MFLSLLQSNNKGNNSLHLFDNRLEYSLKTNYTYIKSKCRLRMLLNTIAIAV